MGNVQRLIVFDLDGTLVDSRRDLTESANELLGEHGAAPIDERALGRMIGAGAATLVQRAFAAASLTDDPAAALPRFLEIYDRRLLNHTRPYPGVAELVRYAHEHARVAVLTNKPRVPSERILAGLGLRELFDEVVGGDGPYPRKPDPASLAALMARADARPAQTLLVGDSVVDHETARRAATRCCLAAYGFGYETFPLASLSGDEWVAESPDAVLSAIAQFVGGCGEDRPS